MNTFLFSAKHRCRPANNGVLPVPPGWLGWSSGTLARLHPAKENLMSHVESHLVLLYFNE